MLGRSVFFFRERLVEQHLVISLSESGTKSFFSFLILKKKSAFSLSTEIYDISSNLW